MPSHNGTIAGQAGPAVGRALAPTALVELARGAFAAERERWFLWSPVLLGCGIAVYFSAPAEPPPWLGLAAALAAALAAWRCRRQGGLSLLCIAALLLALGFAGAQLRSHLVAAPVLAERLGPVAVEGRLAAVAGIGGRWRLVLEAPRVAGLEAAATPAKLRVTLPGPPEPWPAVGQIVRVRAVLMPPPAPAAPGAFDFARQAWFERLGAVGFAVGPVRPADRAAERSLATALGEARQALSQRIRAALPGTVGAVASALMTGDRGAIPETTMAAMRDSGLAHLLAISGLHVGLVTGILFFAVRAGLAACEPLALRWPIKKWAAALAVLGGLGYLLLTGATVPTQRAFAMAALVLLAVLTDRSALSMRTVACAALAILVALPESLLSASFQMSFAAVVALIAAYEGLGRRFAAWRRGAGAGGRAAVYVAGVAVTTVVASLATTPYGAHHFNQLTHYGLAANLLAVPLTSVWIMPFAVLAYVLLPFGLDGLALAPMGWGIEAMLATAETVASWPGAVSRLPSASPLALATVTLGGLWLCLWRGRWRWGGIAAIAAGIAFALAARPPDVLIDGDGRLAAIRTADDALAFTRPPSGYRADAWLRRTGAVAAADGFRCDRLGCVARAAGRAVAYVADERALAEECRRAQIVLSAVPVRGRRCPSAALLIDRFDLWREGAHAIWLDEGGTTVKTAADFRGRRPWAPWRGRARWRPDQ